ncbi:hypothetical protein [Pseudomonas putida]
MMLSHWLRRPGPCMVNDIVLAHNGNPALFHRMRNGLTVGIVLC